LQQLDLSHNQLRELPPEISQLSHLRQLDLSTNQLSELPPEIGQLINLERLDLHDNQLSELPLGIGKLSNLQLLDVRRNQLRSLPPEIGRLINLQQLDLQDNHSLEDPPPEIMADGTKAILNYLQQKLEQGQEYLYEAKFLILGRVMAGKTTLANKLLEPEFELDSQQPSTKGINVSRWEFELQNGHLFRVNIWDFGGQEIYHATHQFFLTKRSLYGLVVDIREDNANLRYWLSIIKLLSESSPVFVIQNEKDDRSCNINEPELRREFINLKENLRTNFMTNRGLDTIQQTIRQYITALPHVGTPLPRKWVEVRQFLESDERNHISLAEYRRICKACGFTHRSHQLQLSDYLHDLGVCLHFRDDDLLSKTIILKPEWSTKAVYSVLDNEIVRANQGCFSRKLLEDIWNQEEYIDMQGELLRLMIRFKLCYEIPGYLDHYIAPQLLHSNAQPYDWDNSSNLIVRYRYEFMPKGIITRLIVELHNYIEAQELVWKAGAVFTNGTARAEVVEHYSKDEIRIRVSGNEQKAWLSVITHELEKIHLSYENLKYEILIPCNCSECKGSQDPETYLYKRLRRRLDKQRYFFECEISYEQVDVRNLLDDVLYQASASTQTDQTQHTNMSQQGLPLQDITEIINNAPIQIGNPRLKLIKSLGTLPGSQFEEIVFALKIPSGILSSSQAPQGQRAKDLLDWAEGPTGMGLNSVLQVLSHYISLEKLGFTVLDQSPSPP
jgi:small GTP-binding protein